MTKPNRVNLNLSLTNTGYDILIKKAKEAKMTPSTYLDKLIREKVSIPEFLDGVIKYGWTKD